MTKPMFEGLPRMAAWRLLGAYEGFEVTRFASTVRRRVLQGTTVGAEAGRPWSIRYLIRVDDRWRIRHAWVTDAVADSGGARLEIESDGKGAWIVNGRRRPQLEGCLDLDLEASVVTNTLPVHRLALGVGQQGESAAVYIRTVGLAVERLEQTYQRLRDAAGTMRFEYTSPRFGYRDTLRYAPDGLVVDYPGIGVRRL